MHCSGIGLAKLMLVVRKLLLSQWFVSFHWAKGGTLQRLHNMSPQYLGYNMWYTMQNWHMLSLVIYIIVPYNLFTFLSKTQVKLSKTAQLKKRSMFSVCSSPLNIFIPTELDCSTEAVRLVNRISQVYLYQLIKHLNTQFKDLSTGQ